MVALASVALIAIAFPLTRSAAGAEDPDSTPVLVVSDGFAAALRSQAETLVSAVTLGSPAPAARDAAISHSLDGFPGGALVPRPLLAAAAGVLVQGVLAGPQGEQGLVMQLQEPVQFTLHEGAFPSLVFSTRPTVGAALAALGAGYGSYDIVSPPPDTRLTAGMHVFVERAVAVSLSVGGSETATVYTQAETVGELLAEQGVALAEGDSVRPGASSPIREGMAIFVTIMGERTFVEDTPIPFETIYQEDPSFPEGESWVAQYGVDGYVHREYLVVYENGEEISRELVSEFVVAPTYHIVAVGTAPAPVAVAAVVEAPSGDPDCARTLTVWATWYTAASAGGSGTTATGTSVQIGTVAVDPSVIPLGTRMYIPGYGHGIAEDTGGAIIGNMIDLGYGPNDVWDWGSRYVDICILS